MLHSVYFRVNRHSTLLLDFNALLLLLSPLLLKLLLYFNGCLLVGLAVGVGTSSIGFPRLMSLRKAEEPLGEGCSQLLIDQGKALHTEPPARIAVAANAHQALVSVALAAEGLGEY